MLCDLARATDYTVTNSATFYNAIQSIDAAPTSSDRIILSNSFTMSQQVLAITTTGSLTVVGNGFVINGNGAYRPFFVESGNVSMQDLTITNAQAHGGNGAGGGMGAGAAVFVDSGANLTIHNVNFSDNAAIGGNGGSTGAGGGGLGGNGPGGLRGGGGGLYGNGGGGAGTGGGGGGELGNGGNGTSVAGFGTGIGGGGGGTTGNGTNGDSGGAAGSQNGGAGGTNGNPGAAAGVGGGGGGSGSYIYGTPGGTGGLFGGGGGDGGQGGRFGGGGGGASSDTGGNGGFGGGGGSPSNYGVGGNGGFGGGGGGGATGGVGGFGGGNAASNVNANGGAGGAAFGGAIFVANGATITVIDATNFSGNTVTGGLGNAGGGNGSTNGNDIFLMAGTTTSFNISSGQTLTFTPAIGNNDGTSNAGVVIDKTGFGTLVLDGTSSYSGSTTVDSGTLVVNSTLAGPMTVNSGGTLMGVGTVGDTTISTGGTIYPGIVGAPLTINGSFTQSTGTTYSAEVSPTDSDKIIVNGHATIQSGTTFNIVLDPGTYTAGTHYVVLTASGGISGTYTNTIMPSPGTGLFFSLIYDPNDIQLIINDPPSASFASFAQTFNQWQVGTALDTISPSATGGMSTLVMQLEGLSSNQIPGALNQLAGDIYPSIASIELQTTTTWLQLISNRLGAKVRVYEPSQGFVVNEKGTSNDPDAEVYLVSYQPSNSAYGAPMRMSFRQATRPLWSAWTQGYGLGGNVASNGNAGALNYGLGGTTFGIDRWLGERTLVGVLGGYAGSSANNVLVPGRSSINGYQVGLYGMHCRDYVYLSNIDAYSNDTYDATRQISIGTINGTAKSNTFSNQWAHYSELGATFTGASVRLQPFGGIQYIYLDQNAFGETGVTPANLNVSQQITNSVRGSAGARLSWLGSIGNVRVIPVVHGRYQREWGDGTRLVTSSFTGAPTVAFNTTGNTLGRDFGLFGLGLTAMITPRTSLYGGYDLQVASRYAANMGSAGFQFRW